MYLWFGKVHPPLGLLSFPIIAWIWTFLPFCLTKWDFEFPLMAAFRSFDGLAILYFNNGGIEIANTITTLQAKSQSVAIGDTCTNLPSFHQIDSDERVKGRSQILHLCVSTWDKLLPEGQKQYDCKVKRCEFVPGQLAWYFFSTKEATSFTKIWVLDFHTIAIQRNKKSKCIAPR